MGGTSKQSGTTSSVTAPWQPAQPALKDILGGIQSQTGNYQPTGAEIGAANQLATNAQGITDQYGGTAQNLTNKFLSGDPTGLLAPALQSYQNTLTPYANMDTNPYSNPAMASMLQNVSNDIQQRVNGQFAGSGRDLSGLNQQYLARGLSEGTTPTLFNQYNTNVATKLGAAGNLYGAAGNTAGAMTTNMGNGMNSIDFLKSIQNAGPEGILSAEALKRGLPLQNLGMLANLTVPIAGLGGTQNGTYSGQNQMSGAQQFATIAQGIGSLFPKAPTTFNF